MFSSFIPPRRVAIGDAAAFVGTTPVKLDRFHLTSPYNTLIAPAVREELVSREIVDLPA